MVGCGIKEVPFEFFTFNAKSPIKAMLALMDFTAANKLPPVWFDLIFPGTRV